MRPSFIYRRHGEDVKGIWWLQFRSMVFQTGDRWTFITTNVSGRCCEPRELFDTLLMRDKDVGCLVLGGRLCEENLEITVNSLRLSEDEISEIIVRWFATQPVEGLKAEFPLYPYRNATITGSNISSCKKVIEVLEEYGYGWIYLG